MRVRNWVVGLLLGWVGLSFASQSLADTTAKVPHGDPAMAAAYAKGLATLDVFLAAWRHPPAGAEGFALKVGIRNIEAPPGYVVTRPGEGEGSVIVEYFWVADLKETAGGFEGALANDSEDIHGVKAGQTIAFKRENVADWTYFLNGKMIGNATACPALAHASADERRFMQQRYGLTCN